MSDEWKDEPEHKPFAWVSKMWHVPTPEEVANAKAEEAATRAVNALAAEHITQLPPFDPNPICPKCGHDGIKWDYGRFTEPPSRPLKLFDRVGLLPYLDLYCLRCEFGNHETDEFWVMSPKS